MCRINLEETSLMFLVETFLVLDSEHSKKCIDFTMMFFKVPYCRIKKLNSYRITLLSVCQDPISQKWLEVLS